jgi:hypothetical protein
MKEYLSPQWHDPMENGTWRHLGRDILADMLYTSESKERFLARVALLEHAAMIEITEPDLPETFLVSVERIQGAGRTDGKGRTCGHDGAQALAIALDWLDDAPDAETWLAFLQRNADNALAVLDT